MSMLLADKVIWLDEEEWSRKGRSHRSHIMNGDEFAWIRVPILTEDKGRKIREVRIDHSNKWTHKMVKKIESIYSRHTFYDYFADEIEALILHGSEFEYLIDWNLYFLNQIMSFQEHSIIIDLQSDHPLPEPPYYFEWNSKNYLPQPVSQLKHDNVPKDHREDESMLHLFFALGPEFFKLADQIYKEHGRSES